MQRGSAVSFIAVGLALMAVVLDRTRLTFISSGVAATLALASFFLTSELGRTAALTALCFLVLSTGFALAEISPLTGRSPLLGVTGLLAAAVGATCCIRLLWGSGAGDPVRLRQFVVNLVGNAIKFTSSGGVTVFVQKEFLDCRKIMLRFTVTDTGIGIPAERHKDIFSSFTPSR